MNIHLEETAEAGKGAGSLRLELEQCQRRLDQCQSRVEQMEGVFNHIADAIFVAEPDGRIIDVNPAVCALLGYSREELLTMHPWDFVASASRDEILDLARNLQQGVPASVRRTYRSREGVRKEVELRLSRSDDGGRDLIIVSCRDVTQQKRLDEDRKWAEGLLAGEKRVLEMVAKGNPLSSILEAVCRLVEEMSSGSLCSILLLDPNGNRLWHGAAPSLPASYTKAIDGAAIGPETGPCGRAAYFRKAVIVCDIAADPLSGEFRDLALMHGLRACWSTPILSSDGRALGTFAIYSREPCSPAPEHNRITEQITHLAAVAIERKRAEGELRRSEASLARAQRLSATGSFSWQAASGEMTWSEETRRICEIDRSVKPTAEMARDLIHPEDAALFRQMLSGGEKDLRFECRLRLPGGLIKHLEVVASALRDDAGQIQEWTGAVMDVTDRKRAEEALRASEQLARGQVEALTRALDALATESAPDRVVEHVLWTITEQLKADSSSVWMKDPGNGLMGFEFAFEKGRLATKSDSVVAAICPTLPVGDIWPWPEVFRTGRPGVLEDIRQGPMFPWREHLLAQGVVTILIVPMLIAGRVEGVIGIRFKQRRAFPAEEMELAQALANQAMLAMQLTRLSEQSRQSAVIAERNRMAREVHDTLAQGFTGVIVQLEAAEDAKSRGLTTELEDHLRNASELARDSLKEARRSVRALRPQALEEKDLCEALDGLFKKMTTGTSLRSAFVVQGEPRTLPPEWDENLLRIGQEVLTNVLRHARASDFTARIAFAPDGVRLDLGDNGCGFATGSKHDGFGLVGIRERVEGMGGELTIRSGNGAGTAILIALPLTDSLGSPES